MCVGCYANDGVAMKHSEKSKDYENDDDDSSNFEYSN